MLNQTTTTALFSHYAVDLIYSIKHRHSLPRTQLPACDNKVN